MATRTFPGDIRDRPIMPCGFQAIHWEGLVVAVPAAPKKRLETHSTRNDIVLASAMYGMLFNEIYD